MYKFLFYQYRSFLFFYISFSESSNRLAEKAGIFLPGSPGTYRKISATAQLTNARNRRITAGNMLAEKMAEVGTTTIGSWPNDKDSYELGEVIGMSFVFSFI